MRNTISDMSQFSVLSWHIKVSELVLDHLGWKLWTLTWLLANRPPDWHDSVLWLLSKVVGYAHCTHHAHTIRSSTGSCDLQTLACLCTDLVLRAYCAIQLHCRTAVVLDGTSISQLKWSNSLYVYRFITDNSIACCMAALASVPFYCIALSPLSICRWIRCEIRHFCKTGCAFGIWLGSVVSGLVLHRQCHKFCWTARRTLLRHSIDGGSLRISYVEQLTALMGNWEQRISGPHSSTSPSLPWRHHTNSPPQHKDIFMSSAPKTNTGRNSLWGTSENQAEAIMRQQTQLWS